MFHYLRILDAVGIFKEEARIASNLIDFVGKGRNSGFRREEKRDKRARLYVADEQEFGSFYRLFLMSLRNF